MEQHLPIGNKDAYAYEFKDKKEVELAGISFESKSNGDCYISVAEYDSCNLSQEELCTFIKLLVSHLELPLEFK